MQDQVKRRLWRRDPNEGDSRDDALWALRIGWKVAEECRAAVIITGQPGEMQRVLPGAVAMGEPARIVDQLGKVSVGHELGVAWRPQEKHQIDEASVFWTIAEAGAGSVPKPWSEQ